MVAIPFFGGEDSLFLDPSSIVPTLFVFTDLSSYPIMACFMHTLCHVNRTTRRSPFFNYSRDERIVMKLGRRSNAASNRAHTSSQEQRTAVLAGLRYVNDTLPGLRREKRASSFRYVGPDDRMIRDRSTLDRIRALVIPPAWTNVWICQDPRGHIQVTGRDARGRKQYRYHGRWREIRDENKYERLISFARALPRIRRRVTSHLQPGDYPERRSWRLWSASWKPH